MHVYIFLDFCIQLAVLSHRILEDGYTNSADQIWPAVPIVLEVLELLFGCLFALEVVLKLWGVGRSLLAPTCAAA